MNHLNLITAEKFAQLSEKHKSKLELLKQNAELIVLYTATKTDFPQIKHNLVTRPFKSYKRTAGNIAENLIKLGFKNVRRISDFEFVLEVANSEHVNANQLLVWVNTGGIQGKDPMSHMTAFLEQVGIPYIGHIPSAYAMSDNKTVVHDILTAHSIPTTRSVSFSILHPPVFNQDLWDFLTEITDLESKFVIKPVNGRGSIDVRVLDKDLSQGEIETNIIEVFNSYGSVKIEEFLSGDDVTVSAVRSKGEILMFTPMRREINPDSQIFTSLDKQSVTDRATPIDQSDKLFNTALNISGEAYDALGLSTLCRMDMRADSRGNLKVIDINPKPDLTYTEGQETNLSQMSFSTMGFDYLQLLELILLCRIDLGFAEYSDFQLN